MVPENNQNSGLLSNATEAHPLRNGNKPRRAQLQLACTFSREYAVLGPIAPVGYRKDPNGNRSSTPAHYTIGAVLVG